MIPSAITEAAKSTCSDWRSQRRMRSARGRRSNPPPSSRPSPSRASLTGWRRGGVWITAAGPDCGCDRRGGGDWRAVRGRRMLEEAGLVTLAAGAPLGSSISSSSSDESAAARTRMDGWMLTTMARRSAVAAAPSSTSASARKCLPNSLLLFSSVAGGGGGGAATANVAPDSTKTGIRGTFLRRCKRRRILYEGPEFP